MSESKDPIGGATRFRFQDGRADEGLPFEQTEPGVYRFDPRSPTQRKTVAGWLEAGLVELVTPAEPKSAPKTPSKPKPQPEPEKPAAADEE